MVSKKTIFTYYISIEEILKKCGIKGDFSSAGLDTHKGKVTKKTRLVVKIQEVLEK